MDIWLNPFNVKGETDAPASKSYAIRALFAGMLSQGKTFIENIPDCDDANAAIEVVKAFGAKVNQSKNYVEITGTPINTYSEEKIKCGESGLLARISACIAALNNKSITIDVEGSLLSRVALIQERTFNDLGVKLQSNSGKFPLSVQGPINGGKSTVNGGKSSQFISGLLMTLPLVQKDSKLVVENAVSIPYLQMTLELVQKFGISIQNNHFKSFEIKGNQQYQACSYKIEGDWSGAAFLLVAAAIGGEIKVKGLNPQSLQADKMITEALIKAGAFVEQTNDNIFVKKDKLNAFIFDASHYPDLIPPLVVLASACSGTSVIKGIERLKYKESNRSQSLCETFAKLGTEILLKDDKFYITSFAKPAGKVIIDPFNDHRIAMAAAISAVYLDNPVMIQNAECVNKSFPDFFAKLNRIMI